MKTTLKRILCRWLVGCMLAVSFPFFAAADEAANDPALQNDPMVLVTIGDSYSSGEGLGDYGDAQTIEKKVKDQDWLAHRSKHCWAGKLELPDVDGSLSKHRNENWYFAASSGATTEDLKGRQGKAYYQKGGDLKNKSYPEEDPLVNAQLDVFKDIPKGTVDYVTVSIGGNDMGFADVVGKTAVCDSFYICPNRLPTTINDKWREYETGEKPDGEKDTPIKEKIRAAYTDIHKAAGDQATILVVGYPTLLAEPVGINLLFDPIESELIDNAVREFNKKLSGIVEELSATWDIRFVSVEEAFGGHEVGTFDPYLNGIEFLSGTEENLIKEISISTLQDCIIGSGSFHPNEQGAEAYAQCVQKAIAKGEKIEPDDAICVTVKWTDPTVDMGLQLKMSPEEPLTIRGNQYYDSKGTLIAYEDESVEPQSRCIRFVNTDVICSVHTYDMNWSPVSSHTMNALGDKETTAVVTLNEETTWEFGPEPCRYATGYWDGVVCTIEHGFIAKGVGAVDQSILTALN